MEVKNHNSTIQQGIIVKFKNEKSIKKETENKTRKTRREEGEERRRKEEQERAYLITNEERFGVVDNF